MSFERKTWEDRLCEYPARRKLWPVPGEEQVFDVEREDGEIHRIGDAFSAENMNGLERRVGTAMDAVEFSVITLENRTNEGFANVDVELRRLDDSKAARNLFEQHRDDRNNPHGVTAAQVQALGVNGTAADASKLGGQAPAYYAKATDLTNAVTDLEGKIATAGGGSSELQGHLANMANPHAVTAAQVGALATGATAADASKLGGQLPAWWMPAGIMVPYAGQAEPAGWLLCDGRAVSRTTYAGLFAAIGTTYGTGNGSSTFNLPDTVGRFALGAAFANRGQTGGEETHTLTANEVPEHDHAMRTLGVTMAAGSNMGWHIFSTGKVLANGLMEPSGGGGAHNNMPPFIRIAHIIKT